MELHILMRVIAGGLMALGLACAVGAIRTIIQPFVAARRERTWAPLSAMVLDVRRERRTSEDGDGHRNTTWVSVVTFGYRFSGRDYVVTQDLELGTDVLPGQPMPIFVNPADPQQAQHGRVTTGSYLLGGCGGVAQIGGAVFAFALGAIFWTFSRFAAG